MHRDIELILGARFVFGEDEQCELIVKAPVNMTDDDRRRVELLHSVKPLSIRATVRSLPYRDATIRGAT